MNGPIDSGTISLRTAVLMALSAVTAGMIWQDVKGDIADHEARVVALEQQMKANAGTLNAICETLQCRQKGMVAE